MQFSFVLAELITIIHEPIYPPSDAERKYFIGLILLGSETVSAVLDFFLGFELWAWMLVCDWR